MKDWCVQYVLLKNKFDHDLTIWVTKAMHDANCQTHINQSEMKCVVNKDKHYEMNDRTHDRTHSIFIDC